MSNLQDAMNKISASESNEPPASHQERFKTLFRKVREKQPIDATEEEFIRKVETDYPMWYLQTINEVRLTER